MFSSAPAAANASETMGITSAPWSAYRQYERTHGLTKRARLFDHGERAANQKDEERRPTPRRSGRAETASSVSKGPSGLESTRW
jgi:hypothetical protein